MYPQKSGHITSLLIMVAIMFTIFARSYAGMSDMSYIH